MSSWRVFAIFLLSPALGAAANGVEGDWHGTLDVGAIQLRLAFHFSRSGDGTLGGTLDSLDQNARGIPLSKVTEAGASVSLEIKSVGATFDGHLKGDGASISGTFRQGGRDFPLTLQRGPATELRRPQDPHPPYPYDAEDVTYDNPKANIRLAGTLTLPRSPGPHPAVLLITGSGPQDRDEAIMGHRPFLVIADYLTRRGIAVLRVDDRGVGKSTGKFAEATTADFAGDARASVDYLKTRKEIDPRQIGLIGHSEGGIIAPMLASQDSDIAFIVMLAGPGVNGEEIVAAQQYLINRASGMPQEEAERSREIERTVLDVVREEPDPEAAKRKIRERVEKMAGNHWPAIEKQVGTLTSPWFRMFLNYDPRPALEKTKVPVLAMNGALDLQVPPRQNLPAIAAALEAGGNPDYQIVKLPHLNHLFQTAQTGLPMEYAKIEETFAPVALQTMGDWIVRHVSIK